MSRSAADRPDTHYDNITQAWQHLMGESFHYGYFDPPDLSLDAATEALTRQMAEAGDLQSQHEVLDVGCGIGGPARYLAQQIGCRVTGFSTSEVGVATARERTALRGLDDRVSFFVRDAMANEFDDRSFDRVWVMESSHLMPDKGAMIREAARVLKPGGRMVLCDIIMHRDLAMPEIMKRARAFDLLRVVFGRARMETLASYRGWCESAGLTVSSARDISQQTAPTFAHWRANAERYSREVAELVGEKALADFIQSCSELEQMWADQILGYGLLVADAP